MKSLLSHFSLSNIFGDLKSTLLGVLLAGLELYLQQSNTGHIDWKGITTACVTALVTSLVKLAKTEVTTVITDSTGYTI